MRAEPFRVAHRRRGGDIHGFTNVSRPDAWLIASGYGCPAVSIAYDPGNRACCVPGAGC